MSSILLVKKKNKSDCYERKQNREKFMSTKYCPKSLSRTALHLLPDLTLFQISSHSTGGNLPDCNAVLTCPGHLCSRPRTCVNVWVNWLFSYLHSRHVTTSLTNSASLCTQLQSPKFALLTVSAKYHLS